jgi:hypothetical protein
MKQLNGGTTRDFAFAALKSTKTLSRWNNWIMLAAPGTVSKSAPRVSIRHGVVRRAGESQGGSARPRTERTTTMKVLVIVKASKDSEAGIMPSERLLREMGNYNEELVKAGILLAAEGLQPSSKGKRLVFKGAERSFVDGPFAETKELVAGFWLWQVKSMAEAMEWARRIPNPELSDGVVEIRPLFSADDFGDALTPELREQEQRQRAYLESERK